jgi:hypothetical protein
MSIDQRKCQEKLAKKKAKRKSVLSSKNKKVSFSDRISRSQAIIIARNSPINRCFVRKSIFPEGIGTAIVSRQMPNGHLGVGVYLLDGRCLGLKHTYFSILIVEKLFRNCGEGNFEYIVSACDESKIL